IGWRGALAAGALTLGALALGAAPVMAQVQPTAAQETSRTPLTYAEAEARLRTTSSLGRAAGYGVQAAEAQAQVAAGLNRPTVSLDAQLIRYRKTFDLSLSDALDRA